MIAVRVLGLVTVQDLGRRGLMHEAVPPGGALVPELLVAANRAASNPDGAAAIEVCGRLVVRAEEETLVAIDGDRARVLKKDETLEIAKNGRAAYLAVRGGVNAPIILGGRGALLCAGLGAPLRSGDRIDAGNEAETSSPDPTPSPGAGPVRIVLGPDLADFSPAAIDALTSAPYRILASSDRVGTRLEGPRISRAGSDPEGRRSRPMVRGAIEVPRDEQPIVLGPEHPTTGGYPLVAIIRTADLGRFHSIPLGSTVRFVVC
jgi:allophanate hydrolase subunit 2